MAEHELPTFEEAVRSGRIDCPNHVPSAIDAAVVVWTTPNSSIRTRVNLDAFASILAQHGWDVAVFAERDGNAVRRAHLLAEPDVSLELVDALREQVDAREHLSEETYWEAMDPIVQGLWDETATGDRISLVLDGGDPIEAALEQEVPQGAARVIWQGLDD